jgi:hypothetical protein
LILSLPIAQRLVSHVFSAADGVPSTTIQGPYELGILFSSDADGWITALRYYCCSAGDVNAHAGNLWDPAGTLIGTATFGAGYSLGWKEVALASPVAITAGGLYCASFTSDDKLTGKTSAGFDSERYRPPLHTPITAGVYNGTPGSYPTIPGYLNSNYWVDVSFQYK